MWRRKTFSVPSCTLAIALLLASFATSAAEVSTSDWLARLSQIEEKTRTDPQGAQGDVTALADQLAQAEADVQRYWQRVRCIVAAANGDKETVTAAAEWLIRTSDAGWPELRVVANSCSAGLYFRLGERQRAYEFAKQAVAGARAVEDLSIRVMAGIQLGQVADRLGEFEAAVEGYQLAQEAAERAGNLNQQFLIWGNLGTLYTNMARIDDALAANDRALALAQAQPVPDPNRLTRIYLQRYYVLVRTDKLNERQQALLQAEHYAASVTEPQLRIVTAINLADHYYKIGRYPQAIAAGSRAIQLAEKDQNLAMKAVGYANRGFARLHAGQAEGRADVDESLRILTEMGSKPEVATIYLELADVLAATGDYQAAFLAIREHKRVSDELLQSERDKRVYELQEQYNSEKREREIALLSKDNALKSVELARSQLERRTWWLMGVVAVLVLAVLVLLYRRSRVANRKLNEKNQQLDFQSTHDALTGLYNRRYFLDYIAAYNLTGPMKPGHTHAAFLVDLDHFKRVNDNHGHAAGDAVLKTVAGRLQQILRDNDVLVRWGGEEFLIFLPDVQLRMLDTIAERLLYTVADDPVMWETSSLPITASFGYGVVPMQLAGELVSWERTLHLIDMALYLAKGYGRNRAFGLHAVQAETQSAVRVIETDLAAALRAGYIEMHMTPGPGAGIDSTRETAMPAAQESSASD